MSYLKELDATRIEVEESRRIITFSDIHADIHSLIIALRDCAQVIQKKEGHKFDIESEYDPELEQLLNIELISKIQNEYPDDLNYEIDNFLTVVPLKTYISNDKTIAYSDMPYVGEIG
jgi:hypothetical protein